MTKLLWSLGSSHPTGGPVGDRWMVLECERALVVFHVWLTVGDFEVAPIGPSNGLAAAKLRRARGVCSQACPRGVALLHSEWDLLGSLPLPPLFLGPTNIVNYHITRKSRYPVRSRKPNPLPGRGNKHRRTLNRPEWGFFGTLPDETRAIPALSLRCVSRVLTHFENTPTLGGLKLLTSKYPPRTPRDGPPVPLAPCTRAFGRAPASLHIYAGQTAVAHRRPQSLQRLRRLHRPHRAHRASPPIPSLHHHPFRVFDFQGIPNSPSQRRAALSPVHPPPPPAPSRQLSSVNHSIGP